MHFLDMHVYILNRNHICLSLQNVYHLLLYFFLLDKLLYKYRSHYIYLYHNVTLFHLSIQVILYFSLKHFPKLFYPFTNFFLILMSFLIFSNCFGISLSIAISSNISKLGNQLSTIKTVLT